LQNAINASNTQKQEKKILKYIRFINFKYSKIIELAQYKDIKYFKNRIVKLDICCFRYFLNYIFNIFSILFLKYSTSYLLSILITNFENKKIIKVKSYTRTSIYLY
jgi:hypothetical protein